MRTWSNEDICILKKIYPFEKNEMISKKINKSIYSIASKAGKLKIRKDKSFYENNKFGGGVKKYFCDENYFENIDTHEKAYVLGFIFADGSVSDKILNITISYKDIEILEFIKKELSFNGNIAIKKKNGENYTATLSVLSKKLIFDLKKYNIIRNKTYETKSLPDINSNFFNSFLLGYFDGDGCIGNNRKKIKEYCVTFSSNLYILYELKNKLFDLNISSSKIRLRRKESIYSGMLEIKGSINIKKLQDYMYKNSLFFMKRKKIKFDHFWEVNKDNNKNFSKELKLNICKLFDLSFNSREISEKLNLNYNSIRSFKNRVWKNGNYK